MYDRKLTYQPNIECLCLSRRFSQYEDYLKLFCTYESCVKNHINFFYLLVKFKTQKYEILFKIIGYVLTIIRLVKTKEYSRYYI